MRLPLLGLALGLAAPMPVLAEETTTVEEEVDLGALDEAAPPTERDRSPWLIGLPLLGVAILGWNTKMRVKR